jgi:PAS domain S-box-containing protein
VIEFFKKLPGLKSGIGRRFILYILLFSSVITFIGTGLQLYLDFYRDLKSIQTTFKQIKSSYLNSITNSLWITDNELLQIQLEGILRLPDMQLIEIRKEAEVLHMVGTPQSEKIIEQTIPLVYIYDGQEIHLGELHVIASLKGVYARIIDRVLLILSIQTIKTFLVSLFIFIIFYQLVGKHILSIASFAESIGFESMDHPIHLDRKSKTKEPDELDKLTTSFNRMQENLVRDINRRDIAEKKLRESEEKYHDLYDNAPDMFASVCGKTKTILECNETLANTLGYRKEEIIGGLIFDIYTPDSAEYAKEKVFPVFLKTGTIIEEELQLQRKDGSSLNVSLNVSAFRDESGNFLSSRSVWRDITDRKKIEAQLQQAQKMESVGRLAGGVAHDYNNALTTIMGYTELALIDADPKGPLHEDLNEILNASRRAKDITRQLLAFARKQTIAPKVLDLNTNIESMLKMIRRLIGEDIDLVWLPGKGLWSVKMDPSQIDQILVNLCVNARDAIEGVGKITIETATKVFDSDYCADHTGFVPGEFVMLTISDNGCGMDKEILNNIFEPFFTTKAVDKGTGLGLSTVYGIVKQNNGFINVYSEPGKGTGIKIYLSRHDSKAVDIQEENKAKISLGHGETILIVEDDMPILKLAQKILKVLKYNVLIADTPKRAMRLAEEYTDKIHLLVTDVIMPEMNGRELSEQLNILYPDLKCIFMSGYTANAIAHHGVLDEGLHFIQKPFSKRDLATIVRKVFDEGKS